MTNPNEMDLNQLGQLSQVNQDGETVSQDDLHSALNEALGTDLSTLNQQNGPVDTPVVTASTESTPKPNPALEVANATLDPTIAHRRVNPVEETATEAAPATTEVAKEESKDATTDADINTDTPELEATLAAERQKSIERGEIVQDVNPLLNEMRKLTAQTAAGNEIAEKTRKILEDAVIDPNNINIITGDDTNPLELSQQISLIEASRPVVVSPVIALKSGFKADMLALTSIDKIDVRNLNGSLLDQTIKMLRIVHRKVGETSVGKIKFDDWLNITAEEDYDTLLYGIYCSTFPKATEYTVTCGHCKTKNNLNLFPSHLLEVVDRENASKYVQEVLEGWSRGKEFLSKSMVATRNRIVLPKSKFVVELGTPTLRNMLDNLSVMQRMKQHPAELVSLLKYISNMYVPNVQALAQGKQSFHSITDQLERLHHIVGLEAEDLTYLRKEITKRVTANMVHYQIPAFQCANKSDCGKEIKNTTVDLTTLLFIAIGEEG